MRTFPEVPETMSTVGFTPYVSPLDSRSAMVMADCKTDTGMLPTSPNRKANIFSAAAYWYPQRVCSNKNFVAEFTMQYDPCAGQGNKADGFAFVIQQTRYVIS